MPNIINGTKLAKSLNKKTAERICNNAVLDRSSKPTLATVLVGNDKASQMYVRMKAKKAKQLGIHEFTITLSASAGQSILDNVLTHLSHNSVVNAILLQLPLPKSLSVNDASVHISPAKDVDGVNTKSIGNLASNRLISLDPASCTPRGIMYMLHHDPNVKLKKGASAVIIGRSNIVGRPLANMLINDDFQVTVLNHYADNDLKKYTRNADLIISATGKANLIKAADIGDNHPVLIDVGENHDKNGKLCGDISHAAEMKSSAYTPVPGGVGPMTIATLMKQTVDLKEYHTFD